MDASTAGRIAFMGVVTCWLLTLVFGTLGERPLEAAFYAITAALGLEYLVSAWPVARR
jgi:hypothetical protein